MLLDARRNSKHEITKTRQQNAIYSLATRIQYEPECPLDLHVMTEITDNSNERNESLFAPVHSLFPEHVNRLVSVVTGQVIQHSALISSLRR